MRHIYDSSNSYCTTKTPNKVRVEKDYKTIYKSVNARIKDYDNKQIIGWKKAKLDGANCLVQLKINPRALRYQPLNKKCRASSAKVIGIYDINSSKSNLKKLPQKMVHSQYDYNFFYEVDKTVRPRHKFDKDHTQECTSGIHFFLTLDEAKNYNLN